MWMRRDTSRLSHGRWMITAIRRNDHQASDDRGARGPLVVFDVSNPDGGARVVIDLSASDAHRMSEALQQAAHHAAGAPAFTCPRCGRTTHHPVDVAESYCGACHDYTGTPT
jgi:hypothetical protein